MTNEEIIQGLDAIVRTEPVYNYLKVGTFTKEWFEAIQETAREAISALSRDRWISVDERLPESGEHVIACCFVKWLGGGGKSYVCDAYYAKPKTLTVNSWGDDIACEYDEETDEYYLLEGWYEVIKNWDDYDSISIGDFVTHWRPLPEPPKEKTIS